MSHRAVPPDDVNTAHSPVGRDVPIAPSAPQSQPVGHDVLIAPRSPNVTPVRRDVPIAPQPPPNAISFDHGFGAMGTPRPTIAHTIDMWKRYLTRTHNIHFQRDFFDTRIRDAAHFAKKWNYICNNPVTKGLVSTPRDWPHSIAFDPATGLERPHR